MGQLVRAFIHVDAAGVAPTWVMRAGATVLTVDMTAASADQGVELPSTNVLLGDFCGVRMANANPPYKITIYSPPGTQVDQFLSSQPGLKTYVFDGSVWIPIGRLP